MPRPRYDNVDPERKQRLLKAATREFAEHGYELASINRILEEAGLSKGSFYYYFDDKADLAATVFLAIGAPMTERGELRMPKTPAEFWAELRRVSLDSLTRLESKRPEYECLMRLSNALLKEPTLAARVLPIFEPSRKVMAGFLEQGVAVGALRSDLPLGTLTAMLEGVKVAAYKSLFPGDRALTEAELESFTDLMIDLAKRICTR